MDICNMIVRKPEEDNELVTVTLIDDDLSESYDYVLYQDNTAILWNRELPWIEKEYSEPDNVMSELRQLAGEIFSNPSVDAFSLTKGCFLWDSILGLVAKMEDEEDEDE